MSTLQFHPFTCLYKQKGFWETKKPFFRPTKGGFSRLICTFATSQYNTLRILMNDQTIVEALLQHDPFVTKLFFYRNCRPLFTSLAARLSEGGKQWEYDEIVSEIYALLMEDDGRRLRTFGFTCSLYQWIKVVALHHLTAHGNVVIDSCPRTSLYYQADSIGYNQTGATGDYATDSSYTAESHEAQEAGTDIERLLRLMPNTRYAEVIRKLTIEGYSNEELAREMNIKASNLYNIKRRAMTMLCHVAQNDRRLYTAQVRAVETPHSSSDSQA